MHTRTLRRTIADYLSQLTILFGQRLERVDASIQADKLGQRNHVSTNVCPDIQNCITTPHNVAICFLNEVFKYFGGIGEIHSPVYHTIVERAKQTRRCAAPYRSRRGGCNWKALR